MLKAESEKGKEISKEELKKKKSLLLVFGNYS